MTNGEQLTDHQIAEIRKSIVVTAETLLGVPYKFGAEWTDMSSKPPAIDCSELVEGVFRSCGLKMPDGSQAQFNFTIGTEYPQDGDLGFFGTDKNIDKIYHVGIIAGDQVIEARAFDNKATFKTGCVILRPMAKWGAYKSFCGWRVHPKLVQIKAV